MKIAEFVAEIMLKGGGKAITDIRNLSAGIKDMRFGLVQALNEFYKITAAAREMAVSLDKYQVNTGLSAEQLQRLSFQASQAGVSMGELGGAIEKLQQANAQARLGYGWDPIFSRLGLTPGQDPVTQLNRIGAALRRMQSTNPAEAKYLASKAGISDNVYYALMRRTTEQMDKQFIITNKEQQALIKLNQQWQKFWFYLKQIGAKLQALSSGLQGRFIKLLTDASKGFLELVIRAKELITANEGLKYSIIAIGLAVAAYFAPWMLALAGIALVLEDIWVYFQGGDSITGRLVQWVKQSQELKDIWEGLKIIWAAVKWELKAIGDEFKFIYGKIKEVMSFIDEHPVLKKIVEYVLGAMKQSAGTSLSPALSGIGGIGKVADYIKNFNADDFFGGFGVLGNVTYNTHVVAHIASTGDVAEDARNVMTVEREIKETQGQQPSLATGGRQGRYNRG